MAESPIPLRPRRRTTAHCPICGKASAAPHVPFCSPGCANLDLHRWLSDGYRVPADEEPDQDDDTKT